MLWVVHKTTQSCYVEIFEKFALFKEHFQKFLLQQYRKRIKQLIINNYTRIREIQEIFKFQKYYENTATLHEWPWPFYARPSKTEHTPTTIKAHVHESSTNDSRTFVVQQLIQKNKKKIRQHHATDRRLDYRLKAFGRLSKATFSPLLKNNFIHSLREPRWIRLLHKRIVSRTLYIMYTYYLM